MTVTYDPLALELVNSFHAILVQKIILYKCVFTLQKPFVVGFPLAFVFLLNNSHGRTIVSTSDTLDM